LGRGIPAAPASRAGATERGARAKAACCLRRLDGRMTESDPLRPLRELPLPVVPEQLSAQIRKRAHAELRPPNPVARAFALAAVVVLCVARLGWTVGFLTKMNAPAVAIRAHR